jgi:pyruvate/2-oxoglutarate dehydrogenase complex dihydrolipoamide dehydrogenase (E3) component
MGSRSLWGMIMQPAKPRDHAMPRVVVIGAGPAGLSAALRAAELGAHTVVVTSGEFGGMAANDGPIPVRTLAHAARLIRDARQLSDYGVIVGEPVLDYPRLLERVRQVTASARAQSGRLPDFSALGITVHERAGSARFVDPHVIETESGLRLEADRIILCTGGVSRKLPLPGFDLTCTHSDAWSLKSVPPSLIVVGGGDTGVQVASIFNAFGSRVQIFQGGPRLLTVADESVSTEVEQAFRVSGIEVHNNFGALESFEKTPAGVRMNFSKDGARDHAEAAVIVVAVGWVANTASLNLPAAGVDLNERGFVKINEYLQTSTPHVFAAGDITGRLMLVPQALQEGMMAGANAVQNAKEPYLSTVSPVGSFNDPEYAQVGLTEAQARESHDILCTVARFESVSRAIIDGRTAGFCKLLTDRKTCRIVGCHVVGERAVEIAQIAAVAIAEEMRVDDLLRIPFSFPTYAGIITRVAAAAARELNLPLRMGWAGLHQP